MRKKLIPIGVVLIFFAAVSFYFDFFRFDKKKAGIIEGSGTIEVTEIEIGSKMLGRIEKIPKGEGEEVKEGDLLVVLDQEELSAQRNSAAASLVNAENQFKRMSELYQANSSSIRDYDNAQASFRVAKANLDRIDAAIKTAVIYSPVEGTVLVKNLEKGEIAFPGSPIITVADLRHPWIKIYVDEKGLGFVKIGQSAGIFIDSYPGKPFPGKVVSISNKAEFTPKTIQTKDERVKLMFAVKIEIENPEMILKPGMPADAEIRIGPVDGNRK